MPFAILLFVLPLSLAVSYPMTPCDNGRITFYTYNNNGMCGFGAIGGPTLPYNYIVAPNEAFYGDGSKCGVCYELTGPNGTVIVQVADMCPVQGNSLCAGDIDHFDLGPNSATFGQVANPSWGQTIITKRQVACPVTGNVGVRTKEGVSAYWMALLVFNHRVGVSMVQIKDGSGVWRNMTRQPYNYWVYSPSGAIVAPFSIQIFSVLNDIVSMSIPSLAAAQVYTSSAQFANPPAGYGGSASGNTPCAAPVPSPIIYDDALFKGQSYSVAWQDVSYGVTGSINWGYTVNPKVGAKCMQVTLGGWGAVQLLRTVPFNVTGVFKALSFWGKVDGSASYTKWKVMAEGGGSKQVTLTSTWTQFVLPLNSTGLNAPNPFGGNNRKFQFQNNQATASPTIYMDDIKLVPV